MGIWDEGKRGVWRLRQRWDFRTPQKAVFGWFATHNLGDDAALAALKGFLAGSWKVITPQTYRKIPGNLEALICGAGGCVNTATARHVLKYLDRNAPHAFLRLLISGGMNRDFADEQYDRERPLLKEFLSQFDFLSARDLLTQRFFNELGFKDTVLIPDLVLALPGSLNPQKEKGTGKKTVGLVLASNNATFKKRSEEITRFLIESCNHLLGRGYEIVCVPFQVDVSSPRAKRHSELVLAEALKEKVSSPLQP